MSGRATTDDARVRHGVVGFLVLTFALSAIFYAWSFAGAPLALVAPPLMWMPAVAAIVTQLAIYRTLAGLGWRLGPWRYLGIAFLVPVVYVTAIYMPVWLTGLGQVDAAAFVGLLIMAPLNIIGGLLLATGEEIGWRGFLAPAFARVGGFGWAGIGTGIVWGTWHAPLLVGSDYNAGTPAWFALPCFMVSVTGIAVVMAWLRLRSGSLWPAALLHATHNTLIQGVFDKSTVDTGPTPWITSEFGIGLAVVATVAGVWFWRRRPAQFLGAGDV